MGVRGYGGEMVGWVVEGKKGDVGMGRGDVMLRDWLAV